MQFQNISSPFCIAQGPVVWYDRRCEGDGSHETHSDGRGGTSTRPNPEALEQMNKGALAQSCKIETSTPGSERTDPRYGESYHR